MPLIKPVTWYGPASQRPRLKSDPCVIRDGNKWVMYYGANDGDGGQQIYRATSANGLRWKCHGEPVLRTGVPGEWDAGDVETPSVVKARGAYHMAYCARALSADPDEWTQETAYQIGHAMSLDGIKWNKVLSNPTIPNGVVLQNWNWAGSAEPSLCFHNNGFHLWFVGINVIDDRMHAHIGYATSSTAVGCYHVFQNNPVVMSCPSPQSTECNGYFTPHVIRDDGKWRMFVVGKTKNFQPVGPIFSLISTDGIHWCRDWDFPMLSRGGKQSWNCDGVFGASVVRHQGKYHAWCSGVDLPQWKWGIGYGLLRGDKT